MAKNLKDKHSIHVSSKKPQNISHIQGITPFKTFTNFIGFQSVQQVAKADVVVIGGGGLFYDYKIYDPFSNFLSNMLFIALLAKIFGKKLYIFSVGANHLDSKISRIISKFILNQADVITVRDVESKKNLERISKKEIEVYRDPAFLLEGTENSYVQEIKNKYLKNKNIIILNLHNFLLYRFRINISEEEFHRKLISILDEFVKDGYMIVMFSTFKKNDYLKSISRYSNFQSGYIFLDNSKIDQQNMIELLKGSKLIIGSQLHSLILATVANVPTIGFIYDKKVLAFLKYTNQEDQAIFLENLYSLDVLRNKIDYIIKNNEAVKQNIQKKLLEIRKNSYENFVKLNAFIQDRDD